MQEDEEIRDSKQTGGPCAVKLSRLNVEKRENCSCLILRNPTLTNELSADRSGQMVKFISYGRHIKQHLKGTGMTCNFFVRCAALH